MKESKIKEQYYLLEATKPPMLITIFEDLTIEAKFVKLQNFHPKIQ